MNSLISVITPNYNADKFVKNTIESVLNQSYNNWEMIIVDDCSTDNSLQIIEEFIKMDNRIRLIKLTKNSGPAVSRNIAIEDANGEYIAFLDSDDQWLPLKLEKQLNFMQINKLELSFTSYESFDEKGLNKKVLIAKDKVKYKDLLTNNYIGCLTAMYSVNKLGKVNLPLIKKRQDWALWLKITKKGVVARGLNITLAKYTRRDNSVSSNKIKLLKYNWKILRQFEKLSFFSSIYYFILLFFKKYFR